MDHPQGILRTGDRATVTFEFISHPEFIKEGMKLLFREGKTKVRLLPRFPRSFGAGPTTSTGPRRDYTIIVSWIRSEQTYRLRSRFHLPASRRILGAEYRDEMLYVA